MTLIQKKIQSASSLSELNSIIDYISSITNEQKKKIIEISIENLKINTVIEFEECSKQHAVSRVKQLYFYYLFSYFKSYFLYRLFHTDFKVFIEAFKLKTKNIFPSYI